jgi:hypothetical protein
MPFVTQEQKDRLDELKCRREGLDNLISDFVKAQTEIYGGIQREYHEIWLQIAKEHNMDLAKYEYTVNGATNEIVCLGERE